MDRCEKQTENSDKIVNNELKPLSKDEKLAHLCFIAECTKDKDQRNDFATILNITGVLSQFEQNK